MPNLNIQHLSVVHRDCVLILETIRRRHTLGIARDIDEVIGHEGEPHAQILFDIEIGLIGHLGTGTGSGHLGGNKR